MSERDSASCKCGAQSVTLAGKSVWLVEAQSGWCTEVCATRAGVSEVLDSWSDGPVRWHDEEGNATSQPYIRRAHYHGNSPDPSGWTWEPVWISEVEVLP